MLNAKQLIDKFIRDGIKSKKDKKSLARSANSSAGLRRNKSMLSMDCLDIDDDDEASSSQEGSGASSSDEESSSKSQNSNDPKQPQRRRSGFDSDDDGNKRSKNDLGARAGNKTERTADHRVESSLVSPKQSTEKRELTLEEEVERKLAALQITQEMINEYVYAKKVEGKDNTPTKMMKLDKKHYELKLFPTFILQKAYQKVTAVGSATALIAILNGNELHVANIGDSGFFVIRFKNGEPYVPYKSKEQQHSFNIPYQLSQLPTQADLEILRKRGKKEEVNKLRKVLRKKNNVV